MKKSEFEKLKHLDIIDLERVVYDKKNALVKLRFDLTMGKVKNISEIKKIKKDIAQILTLINQKKKDIN